MHEEASTKRCKPNGSIELTDYHINFPKLQPPVPHHEEVYVLRKLHTFSRWQRRYCVMSTGIMKLYGKSTDPYKGRHPLQTIDLSNVAVTAYPKERKLIISSKACKHHIKTKKKVLFDRLLGNLHNHRSYALTVTEARQTMCKSYQNLSSLFATIISKKDISTAENLYDQMGQIIKDLEYINQLTANLTNVFESNVEKVAATTGSTGKRRFSLQNSFRSRINALRQKIRRTSDAAIAEVKSEESHFCTNGQEVPKSFEVANSPLKDYLVVQRSFLDIAKLFVDKAAECMASIRRGQQSQKEAMKLEFLNLTELTRTRLEHDLNATQTAPMLSFSQDSKSEPNENFTVRMANKERSPPDDDSDDDGDDDDDDEKVLMSVRPKSPKKLRSPPNASIGSPQRRAQVTPAVKMSNKVQDAGEQSILNKTAWELYHMNGVAVSQRQILPTPMSAISISLWSILKQCFGKNLTRISLPVFIFEPLNMLQVLCEELEYSTLLDKAAMEEDRCMRMAYVALFAASRYKSTQYRTGRKPFNPVIGETYEYVRQDLGWRFVSEQVSHHPPISACHAESMHWLFWQSLTAMVKFWGRSIEAIPICSVHVLLKNKKEEYTWNKATSCLRNILSDNRYFEHYGEMIFSCKSEQPLPIKCKLQMKADYYKRDGPDNVIVRGEIFGQVLKETGEVALEITGNWTTGFFINGTCAWRPNILPENYEKYYGFTQFGLSLNDICADNKEYLPPSDTRFRPDQRMVEEGRLDEAEERKQAIEEFQRSRRKRMAREQKCHVTKWFDEHHEENGMKVYSFNYRYWKAREQRFQGVTFESCWG
uniref:Oxysterol-binding protein n=1 Tax=Trichuris muris TaxID=70415 RepID=A0A5S6QW99_TRIMR